MPRKPHLFLPGATYHVYCRVEWVPAGILIASAWVDDLAYWAGTVSIGRSGSAAHSCSEAV